MKVKTSITLDYDILNKIKEIADLNSTSASMIINTVLKKYLSDPQPIGLDLSVLSEKTSE